MKKTTILLTIVIILVVVGIFISLNNILFTGQTIKTQRSHSSTIAICNETNYCEDYEVECEGEKTVKTVATGLAIQHEEKWTDPRGEQNLETVCNN